MKTREQSRSEETRFRPPERPLARTQPPLLRLQRSLGNQTALRLLQRKCACGGTCDSCSGKKKLPIGDANDHYEHEAERMSGQVMRQEDSSLSNAGGGGSFASHPSQSARRMGHPGVEIGTSAFAPPIVGEVLHSAGRPLDSATRGFMEPWFGHDFSPVRIHTDGKAAESARAVDAHAYTVGNNIVFGSRQYAPESDSGRRLLAHELTHVVQQTGGASGMRVARQHTGTRRGAVPPVPSPPPPAAAAASAPGLTIAPSCAAHEADITAAWSRAIDMLRDTIGDLDNVVSAMTLPGGPRRVMPRQAACITTSFGDVGGLDGAEAGESVFTLLSTVIGNFRRIQSGFTAGRTLRCDPETVPDNECTWRSAFVVAGNSRDIFLCQNFFSADNSVVIRAATLIHEMAHSVLRVSHQGIPEMTFPQTFFDYSSPLGLDFDDARRNAFAYEILANCLEGEPPTPLQATVPRPPAQPRTGTEARGSISLTGGATVTPAIQGLAGIAGRLSLRPGSMVIFNPYIGLNVLYSPTTTIQPAGFFTGMAEVGLRIQQPARGAYLDISGGGFVGFEAPLGSPLQTTAGLSAGLGAGWRWDRIELGAETRALFPLTSGDPDRVVVLGRFAVRLGQ